MGGMSLGTELSVAALCLCMDGLFTSVPSRSLASRRHLSFVPSPTMARRPPCLSLLLLLAVVGQVASEFRICAYNLQEFNKMKASDYRVKNILMRVRDNVSDFCPNNLDFCCCWVKQRCVSSPSL